MKFTVEAFKLIENKIDTDLSSTTDKRSFSDKTSEKKIPRCRTNRSRNSVSNTKESEYSGENNTDHSTVRSYAKPSEFSLQNNINRRNSFHENRKLENVPHRKSYSFPGATSTLLPDQFSSFSKMNEEAIPCFDRSEVTVSVPSEWNGNDYEPYSDNSSSKITVVKALFPDFERDFKRTLNRILERFGDDYNEGNKTIDKATVQTITDTIYDDLSRSFSYGNLLKN